MPQPISNLAQIAPRGLSTTHPLLETLACLSCPARKSDICGSMTDDEIRTVANSSSRIKLKMGDTLVWDGDEAKHAYVVTHGTLRASKANDDGRRQVLSFMFVGQFIGESSILRGTHQRAGGETALQIGGSRVSVAAAPASEGAQVILLRPEQIRVQR